MRARDGVDDREPEADAAARPRFVRPAEALESVRDEVVREAEPSSLTRRTRSSSTRSASSRTVPSPCVSALSTRLPSACSSRSRSPGSCRRPPPRSPAGGAALAGEPARHGVEQLPRVELCQSQRRPRRSGRARAGPRRADQPVDFFGRGADRGAPAPRASAARRRANSSSVRRSASGVRSSWPASATKRRSRAGPRLAAPASRSASPPAAAPRRAPPAP